jgi:UDP-N-acetylmuramoyl-tripeptide--D-alanyl-D-alanine ligase
MMALWASSEAALATGGTATAPWSASGISIDTRSLEPGDLFVALHGDARDGHAFAAKALQNGASAALVNRIPADVRPDSPLLIVADTLLGLEALGQAARARTKARIVAVTGSAGKTTTKEILRLMLTEQGHAAASAASYNNHWGVPLSLARMPKETAFGIFEIGMNHAGEIRKLVGQVRPHVAVITTIAPAHIEFFGTLDAIADAKAEILEGIEPGGACLLPGDNEQFAHLRRRAQELSIRTIASFGIGEQSEARLLSSATAGDGQQVNARVFGKNIDFRIAAPGRHIALNAVAALAAVTLLGGDLDRAASALAGFAPLKGRGARTAAGDIEIIDESYNANPASMAAALDVLRATPVARDGRRIAVLGDMLELGADSERLHAGLASHVTEADADLVFLCGPQMRALWARIPNHNRGAYLETSARLAAELVQCVRPDDVVLVKGSLGSRMAVIVEALKNRKPAAA